MFLAWAKSRSFSEAFPFKKSSIQFSKNHAPGNRVEMVFRRPLQNCKLSNGAAWLQGHLAHRHLRLGHSLWIGDGADGSLNDFLMVIWNWFWEIHFIIRLESWPGNGLLLKNRKKVAATTKLGAPWKQLLRNDFADVTQNNVFSTTVAQKR